MQWSKKFWQEMQQKAPILCVDGVVVNDEGEVVLSKRKVEPFKGYWHVPGGVVRYGKTVEKEVVRVMQQEIGLKTKRMAMIGVYSDFKRDPRGHFVTVAFLMKPVGGKLRPDFQASEVKYFKRLPQKMGFDARRIASDGLKLFKRL